jgi:hypothetical protein
LRRRATSRDRRALAPALFALLVAGVGCGPIAAPPVVEPFHAVVRIAPPDLVPPASRPARGKPRAPLPEGTRIGQLGEAECFAELDRFGVPYQKMPAPVPGIAMPIRLTGPVGGVTYRSSAKTQDSPYTLLDCRLARALVDLSAILRALNVVEVIHYSMHRPDHKGKELGGGSRAGHRGGLAIDAAIFRRADGTALNILKQFKGRRRTPVCGPKAARGATPEARALREIVCRAEERQLFHVLLTPNHDYAHRNHFHMEVRPDGVKWFLLK